MSYTKDDIPDFLQNVGGEETDSQQRIDTDILEPVIFSDSFIRFQLQNKGILNPKSRITFSFKSPSKDTFLPLGVGVGSLIQRATLKIGGKTICEVDDWSHYSFYKSLFTDQQVVKDREQYTTGRGISNAVVYEDNANTSAFIGMDLGREFTVENASTDTNMKLQTFQKLNSTPVFSLSLDELIPCLRSVSLPLFMLKEEVQVELTLSSTVGKRACFEASLTADKDTAIELNQNDVRMIADYTFLDGEAMNRYAQANKDFQYTFLEPRLTKTTISSVADAQNIVRNIGGAGRRVPKMFVLCTTDKSGSSVAGHNQMTLLNDYRAVSFYTGNEATFEYGELIANIKKNDAFIFPIDRVNSALHYHGVQQTEGAVHHITREMYARQGNSLAPSKFEGYELDSENELSGQFFVNAFRFPDGQRVDSRGLELHFKYSGFAVDELPITQRVYIEIEKRMVIRDGVVDTVFE